MICILLYLECQSLFTVVEQAEVTKTSIRRKVWEHLEKNKLVNFPRPVYGRIPNFKGCELAAAKVVELDEFKSAQNIKVNPDKPQEPVRFAVLEHQKHLFVPIPRLASGLLKHILLPEDCNKEKIRQCVSRKGIEESGKDVGIADDVKIDLVVLGSVAVSREGLFMSLWILNCLLEGGGGYVPKGYFY